MRSEIAVAQCLIPDFSLFETRATGDAGGEQSAAGVQTSNGALAPSPVPRTDCGACASAAALGRAASTRRFASRSSPTCTLVPQPV